MAANMPAKSACTCASRACAACGDDIRKGTHRQRGVTALDNEHTHLWQDAEPTSHAHPVAFHEPQLSPRPPRPPRPRGHQSDEALLEADIRREVPSRLRRRHRQLRRRVGFGGESRAALEGPLRAPAECATQALDSCRRGLGAQGGEAARLGCGAGAWPGEEHWGAAAESEDIYMFILDGWLELILDQAAKCNRNLGESKVAVQ